MKTFYTYMWLREDGTPYYVGKGTAERAFSRHHRAGLVVPPRDRIIVQNFESEREACDAEVFLIAFYGRKQNGSGSLWNLCDGGQFGLRGEFRSDSHRKRLNAAIIEVNKSRRGKIMPPGWLEKMQAGARNMSEEARSRMWAGAASRGKLNLGRKLSQEHRLKIGQAGLGRKLSEETKLRMRKPKSPEHREKLIRHLQSLNKRAA